MKVTLFNADTAQLDPRGKVHALGIGWSWIPTPTPPMAVVAIVDLDEDDQSDAEVLLTVELVGPDNRIVHPSDGSGAITATIAVKPDPDSPRMMGVLNIGDGVPLSAGRHRWRVRRGEIEHATLDFDVRETATAEPATPPDQRPA